MTVTVDIDESQRWGIRIDQFELPSYPVTRQHAVITGAGDQGQNIVAMRYVEEVLESNVPILHNGCVKDPLNFRSLRIPQDVLSDGEKLTELMQMSPNGSLFIVADADLHPAICDFSANGPQDWSVACLEKQHRMVLTTVRGREHRLPDIIMQGDTSHIQVSTGKISSGLHLHWASGVAQEKILTHYGIVDHETVVRWLKITSGFYRFPPRPDPDELIAGVNRSIAIASNYAKAVLSTETPMPKHPANSFILTRIAKSSEMVRVRTTEMMGFLWMDSENKQVIEEYAITCAELACEDWGIAFDGKIKFNTCSTYPDAKATMSGEVVNLEVTRVQPKWDSGATVAYFTAAHQAGKAVNPKESPVITCRECGTVDALEIRDIHTLPQHDPSHSWTCTYPASMLGPGGIEPITALPELFTGPEQLKAAVTNAAKEKSDRAQRFGRGQQNWLVLVIEGFFPTRGLNEQLLYDVDWGNMDGVIALISPEFYGAIHGLYPQHHFRIALLKCPYADQHFCYHPGSSMVAMKWGTDMEELVHIYPAGINRGIAQQVTGSDGDVLATLTWHPPEPQSLTDYQEQFRSAFRNLPYARPSNSQD